MAEPRRHEWRFDVSADLLLPGSHEIAVSVVAPARFARSGLGTVLCCLPGGSLSRRYWDLESDGDRRFSFAEFMAARGFATIAIDHLGVGESSEPYDDLALEPMRLARANEAAFVRALQRLYADLRPRTELRSIGVGHSMGSCMTVVQQAHYESHAAIVLMSFTTQGLPHFLTEAERRFAGDASGARAALPELVRARFGTLYPDPPNGAGREAAYRVWTAPDGAVRALQGATTKLAAGPGILSMIPGAFAPEAEMIDVPVFLAVGDHDLHTADHASAEFPRAPEVVAYTLRDCGHCHNVENTRERLWERIAHWIDGAVPPL